MRLRVGCPDLKKLRRRGNPRVFFHVTAHGPDSICTVAEAATLDDRYLVGLMLHELGHPMAEAAWGRSDQVDADEAVLKFFGIKLAYDGPLLLERVSDVTARRILGA